LVLASGSSVVIAPMKVLPHIHGDRLDGRHVVEREAPEAADDTLAGPLGSHVDDMSMSDPLSFLDKSVGGGNLSRVWGVEAR
jgi:hypothetical protein